MKGTQAVVLFLCIWCCIKSFNSTIVEHRLNLVEDRARDILLKDLPEVGREDVRRHKQVCELETEVNRLRLKVERLERETKNR